MYFGTNNQKMSARERVAATLRNLKMTAKEIARSTGATPRSVENWRAANASMSLEAVVAMCREHDEFWIEFSAMCGRPSSAADAAKMIDDFVEWRKTRALNAED